MRGRGACQNLCCRQIYRRDARGAIYLLDANKMAPVPLPEEGAVRANTRVRGIASLVEQTARAIDSLCWTADLQASQWSALRFFGSAGERARNVVGLARYQGTNPGTASRTIAVLVRRGLLDVTVSSNDKRARIVSLTADGQELLARDPLRIVEHAIGTLSSDAQTGLFTGLKDLLAQLHGAEERPPPI